MKLCRFQPLEFAAANIARAPRESHPHVRHGIIEANTVHEFSGELWGARELTGHKWPLDSVKFLPPSVPSKIVCIGKNYVDDANEDVRPYILGYTCFNDVTARDLQKLDGQWTRGKSFDTFSPFGPLLESELNLADTRVETYVNGVRKQSASVSEMIFSVDVIIRWIAEVMTLEPGDVIATGTPAGIGTLADGDVVEVSVTGIGT